VKFYTEQGNWDIVGNNTPVFFFRDPLKFPDLNHAVKRDPKTNLRNRPRTTGTSGPTCPRRCTRSPIVMSATAASPSGLPASCTASPATLTASTTRPASAYWVKFHHRSQQGLKNLTDQQAADIIAGDRESSQRALFDAIEAGDFPKWKMYVQVMPEADAEKVPTTRSI
jgi:catalase